MRLHLRPLALVLALLAILPGLACTPATGPTPPPTPLQHQALINLAVSLGTSFFLKEHPPLAGLVYRIAHDAANATEGALDITQLAPTLTTVIDRTNVSAGDKLVLRELIVVILAEVQAYIARAHLAPTQVQLVASEVFAAMERAALTRLGGMAPGGPS